MSCERNHIKPLFKERLKSLGLEEMLNQSECIKKARSLGDADVYRYPLGEGYYVLLKSYSKRCWLIRQFVARFFLEHEQKILQLLEQDNSVQAPQPYDVIGAHTIAMEFFQDAETLRGAKHYDGKTMPSRQFFHELIEAIRHLHSLGIAHGDLRRGNLMIDREGHLRIIDVATACHGGISGTCLQRLIFRIFRKSDNYSLAKIVRSYYPDMLDNELKQCLSKTPWYLKSGRFLRQKIYRPLRGKKSRAN